MSYHKRSRRGRTLTKKNKASMMRLRRQQLGAIEQRTAWGMILPALIVIFALSLYPMLYTLFLSLNKYNLIKPKDNGFVWFEQYAQAFTDPKFWHSMIANVAHLPALAEHVKIGRVRLVAIADPRLEAGEGGPPPFSACSPFWHRKILFRSAHHAQRKRSRSCGCVHAQCIS